MRELENEVALLKEKLNSSKQEEGKDIDDVKPVQHKRRQKNNTPKEVEGTMKEHRNNIYII